MVGPQLVWDRAGTVLFPVAEDPSPASELARVVRRRWQLPWRVGLGSWLDRMWSVWRATGPVAVSCLRGPLLAMGRETAERFGPLDEGYFLYYEETEWLLRARQRGARFAVTAGARVEHHWGHSTELLADRERVEQSSRDRFFIRNYPAPWRVILSRAARGRQRAGVRGTEVTGPDQIPETPADLWLFSTFPHLQPAVGALDCSRPPGRIAEVAAHGRWYALAAVRNDGRWRIRGSWTWGRP